MPCFDSCLPKTHYTPTAVRVTLKQSNTPSLLWLRYTPLVFYYAFFFFPIKVPFLWPKKQYISMWLVPNVFLKQLVFPHYLLCLLCSKPLNLIKYDYISHFWNIIVAIPLYKSHFLTLDITCSFLYFKFQFPCYFPERGLPRLPCIKRLSDWYSLSELLLCIF